MLISRPNTFSALALIGANLIPLVGVVFYSWDPSLVLALFWIENLVIGAFNLLKMLSIIVLNSRYGDLFVCFFFILHYGLFCSIHGYFLWDILGFGALETSPFPYLDDLGPLEIFAEGAAILLSFIDRFQGVIWFGICALVLSHLVSFVENFILKGEIFTKTTNILMTEPYAQIIALHVGLILGAIVLEKLGSPIWLLALIVSLKLVIDLTQHQRRRAKSMTMAEQIKDI